MVPDPAQRHRRSKSAQTCTRRDASSLGRRGASLLEAACGDKLEALFVLAVTTGMRRGELLGLKWDDVDLSSTLPTVRVRQTLTRKGTGYVLGEPKTKKRAAAP